MYLSLTLEVAISKGSQVTCHYRKKNISKHFFLSFRVTKCFYAIIVIKHDFQKQLHLLGPSGVETLACSIDRQENKIEAEYDKTNILISVPSEDLDQLGHPPSLTRVFAVCLKKPSVLGYPLSAQ